ncbi:MAG: phosphotransferase [Oscillospiraceae bacterium]|nr:phosphotransferase [Oscillospiraceae bacterium]
MQEQITAVAKLFTGEDPVSVRPFGRGHVNETYLVQRQNGTAVILQKINTKVFRDPVELTVNAVFVSNYLLHGTSADAPRYLTAGDNKYLVGEHGNYWRAYEFIGGAHTPKLSGDDAEIEEFGRVLGDFHARTADFPADKLYFTIPDYHNTPAHYLDFKSAAEAAPSKLLTTARNEIIFAEKRKSSCSLLFNMELPSRVTHNDARIENVMFDDDTDKALCLIDYDTLMPGVYAFDFGAAVGSVCFGCDPDERDLSKVAFDAVRFERFTRGYLSRAFPELVGDELKSLAMGVRMMSFEAGLGYLTDYLADMPGPAELSPLHNLVRARVAFTQCSLAETHYKQMCQILIRCAKQAAKAEQPQPDAQA